MANIRNTMLAALETRLSAVSGVKLATTALRTPDQARANVPYVGIVSMGETVAVEDSTNIRYRWTVSLIVQDEGRDVELLIDKVKDSMLDGMAAAIGAKALKLTAVSEVNTVEADNYSSARLTFEIIYVSEKGAA